MMKKFLKNVALFLGFAIAGICLIQLGISIRISGKAVSGYDDWDTKKNINADLVLMGSSRGWVHFDPRFFEKEFGQKAVNISFNGHPDIIAAILRLKNYLAKNKPPKFAILNFDPYSYPGSIPNTSYFIGKNYYSRFAFLPSKENEELLNYFKFKTSEKYIPLYAIFKYQQLRDCVLLEQENIFKEGFECNDEVWDTIKYPINGYDRSGYIKANDIGSLKKQLLAFKSLCHSKKIKLLCIQTPIYKCIYDGRAFAQSAAICKSLGIPFLDANKPIIYNDITNFYNANHLNKKGVIEMNKLLKNEKELRQFFKINP